METRANYVVVGAFVVLLLIGIVGAAFWIASSEFNREFAEYDIYFTGSVTGLAQGAPVRYNGIQVGRVVELRIDPQNLQQVRVTIEIDPSTPVKSDAVASLETQGLTGVAFVEIAGGSPEAAALQRQAGQRYPVIASRPSGLQQVVANAPEALARLIEVADRVAAVLDDKNRAALAETLDNVRRFSSVIANRSGDIDSSLGDAAAAVRELRGALTAGNQALSELKQLLAKGGEGNEAFKTLDEAAHRLDSLTVHLDAIVQENRQPFRDFGQRGLNELSQLMVDARTLVANLNRVADELQRDPPRFFFGDRREGYQPR